MDVEESPDRQPSAYMEDVNMEALDLEGDNHKVEPIQQTQASQAERADDVMETEASAAVEVTNERSLIAEEGAALRSSAGAPPLDDEVTHF
jgi:hypothetical protein